MTNLQIGKDVNVNELFYLQQIGENALYVNFTERVYIYRL